MSVSGLRKSKGFTLVELIAVLVLIALMAAILVPSLLGHVDRANTEALYAAGDNCRVAAQLKLSALEFMEQPPNRNIDNQEENSGCGVMWSRDFSDAVVDMAGVDVYRLYMGIGQYEHYSGTKSTGPAYTVYLMAYQKDEESPMVFFNGEEWSLKCPWSIKSASTPTLQVQGRSRKIQFFCLKYSGEGSAAGYFSSLEELYK